MANIEGSPGLRYEFDLRGCVVVRGALGGDELACLNGEIDRRGGLRAGSLPRAGDHFLEWGAPFRALLTHSRISAALVALCSPRVRFDHAEGVQLAAGDPRRSELHGQSEVMWGDSYYLVAHGRPYCGLTVVSWALTDQPASSGGFRFVAGSHKANFALPDEPGIIESLAEGIDLCAGDVVIFTDNLAHGSGPWTGPGERRSLLIRYAPAPTAWAHPALVRERFLDHMDTDEQRALFAYPNQEQYVASLIGYELPAHPTITRP